MKETDGEQFNLPDCDGSNIEQKTSELISSWDPGGTGNPGNPDPRHLESVMKSRDLISKVPCAVPTGLCHAVKGSVPVSENMDLLSPDVRILCINSGCDYGGPVHYSCLNRWNSCCELRCRMLASVLVPSAGLSVPQIPGLLANATAAMQDGLLTLYRCPQCGQCTLSQMVINEVGKLTQVMYFLIKHVSSSIKQMKHFYALNPTNRTGLNSGHGTNLTYHCPNK
ncbi:hypothetical protein FBUS_09521 [Fasciolopsis buskii]|uniref:Uncharacterized protein n=1 Tax=Fasciolopsis buskii TaxID=27845 RepID=A0A8E0S5N8_9TREM|nr:hypothetical protein FBUS_09521 [Fasciolopsis buski]